MSKIMRWNEKISQTWSITKGQKVQFLQMWQGVKMTWHCITHLKPNRVSCDNSAERVNAYLGVVKEWTKGEMDGKAIVSNFLNT